MPDRLEVIQLAIELRDAANTLAKLTCDTRIPDETLAAYLEAEVRPDYKALRRALREPVPQAAGESESPLAWVRPDYRALRKALKVEDGKIYYRGPHSPERCLWWEGRVQCSLGYQHLLLEGTEHVFASPSPQAEAEPVGAEAGESASP